jgi:hypothetical protein
MDQELDESQYQIRKQKERLFQISKMYPTMMMNPWNSFPQNEHSKLLENYKNVSLQVTYLQEIINNLENKIQGLENRKNVQKTKVFKKCKFFNTGFCKSCDNCPFQHPASLCREHLEDGKCSSFRTCQHRHPRECRYFKRVKSCFHGESCAYHQVSRNNQK